ncbi:magnesium and cobalt transport protein CorA [Bacteroidota bacterium]|nr:magnesium and cobalt transport protein CorA [Bacteroidota bacterium]
MQNITNRIKENSHAASKTGLPPGRLVYIGKENPAPVRITVIDYDAENFVEREVKDLKDCFAFKETETVTWINIDGIHHTDVVDKIGAGFNIHPLFLEDIVNTEQRPKVEEGKGYNFIVFKMLDYNNKTKNVEVEQLSLIVGKNYLISFQENIGDIFDSVRNRVRNPDSRIRKYGTDYLAYALMDKVIDNYFVIMEKMGERVEEIEDSALTKMDTKFIRDISYLRRELILLRKTIWPLREVINTLLRGEVKEIKPETLLFYRDLYDHTVQVIDSVESYRDTLASVLDVNFSVQSFKMNDVMKVLTIISTIFMPLTFIVGIYGMNFDTLPELHWRYGYQLIMLIMAGIAIGMIYYFRKKKWL